jgi:hypothetical protein
LLISRKTAEQDTEITSLETDYYSHDNPELRKAQAIKQRELSKKSRELALEKINTDREAISTEFEVNHYIKASNTVYQDR